MEEQVYILSSLVVLKSVDFLFVFYQMTRTRLFKYISMLLLAATSLKDKDLHDRSLILRFSVIYIIRRLRGKLQKNL